MDLQVILAEMKAGNVFHLIYVGPSIKAMLQTVSVTLVDTAARTNCERGKNKAKDNLNCFSLDRADSNRKNK